MLEHLLSKARQILKEAQGNLSVDMAATVELVYGDIESLINYINKEIDIIQNQVDLDESTKRSARREILENAGRKLEVIKTNRSYAAMDDDLKAKLLDAPVPEKEEDPLLKFLREREIRDRLYGMTEAQIKSHFGESLFDGSNLLLLDAILNAPPGFELLPESTLKKLRWIRVVKLNPEVASKLDMARKMNSEINRMLTLIKKELDNSRLKELPASIAPKSSPK